MGDITIGQVTLATATDTNLHLSPLLPVQNDSMSLADILALLEKWVGAEGIHLADNAAIRKIGVAIFQQELTLADALGFFQVQAVQSQTVTLADAIALTSTMLPDRQSDWYPVFLVEMLVPTS